MNATSGVMLNLNILFFPLEIQNYFDYDLTLTFNVMVQVDNKCSTKYIHTSTATDNLHLKTVKN